MVFRRHPNGFKAIAAVCFFFERRGSSVELTMNLNKEEKTSKDK
tara:strand:- start:324 stop:455 length:132 start_codon:yes stop_codon:yes gene_type:complete